MTSSVDSFQIAGVVVFIGLSVGVGSFADFALRYITLPVPYTVIVFYSGFIIGVLRNTANVDLGSYIQSRDTGEQLIVYLFLPALLFSETMNLSWHQVKRSFSQAAILAGPGSILVCLMLGSLAYCILPFQWGWLYSMLFGAILSATDPVSVVDLLKRTKASSKLTTVIAGESLLNDGSAMILYLFFANLLVGETYTASSFITFVLQMLFVSPLIGFSFGYISYRISRILHYYGEANIDLVIIVSILCGYGSFYVAEEMIGVSGVLSCCTAGVCYSVFVSPSILDNEKMLHVWHHLEWTCNTSIFFLAGLIGGIHSGTATNFDNLVYVLVMYIMLLLTRGIALLVLYPVLNYCGEPFTPQEALFSAYAGLRGALGIALALSASGIALLNRNVEVANDLFLFVTYLSSLTLLINGSLAEYVIVKLGLVTDPKKPISAVNRFIRHRMDVSIRKNMKTFFEHSKDEFGLIDSSELIKLCPFLSISEEDSMNLEPTVDNPIFQGESPILERAIGETGDVEVQVEVDPELLTYVRTMFLQILRYHYKENMENGKIGSSVYSAKLLMFSNDVALDDVTHELNDWQCLIDNMRPNSTLRKLCNVLDGWLRCCQCSLELEYRLEAINERIALYVLANYIEAHEVAQEKILHCLGRAHSSQDKGRRDRRDRRGGLFKIIAYFGRVKYFI